MENHSDVEVEVFPFVRMPIVDRDAQLIAYNVCHQAGETSLADATLQLFEHPGLAALTGDSLAFLAVDRTLLREHADRLRFSSRLGLRVAAELAVEDGIREFLHGLAQRGVPIVLEDPDWSAADPDAINQLIQNAYAVGIDVRRHDESTLLSSIAALRAAAKTCLAIASHLDDHRAQRACMGFGFDAFEGGYLFTPAPEEPVDAPKPHRMNVLRLLAAVQNPDNGPIELEELIRSDAVLSYRLLNCVNSAYFGLPRELKSLQQAAVYFGVTRLRNWVYSLAIGDLDDAPPELLKQALLRARMSELLAAKLPADQRELAFITGLFSMLDSIMGIPMERVLADIPMSEQVRQALIENHGPLATVLNQIRGWESGGVMAAELVRSGGAQLADAYLRAVEWAEHVYSYAAPASRSGA